MDLRILCEMFYLFYFLCYPILLTLPSVSKGKSKSINL